MAFLENIIDIVLNKVLNASREKIKVELETFPLNPSNYFAFKQDVKLEIINIGDKPITITKMYLSSPKCNGIIELQYIIPEFESVKIDIGDIQKYTISKADLIDAILGFANVRKSPIYLCVETATNKKFKHKLPYTTQDAKEIEGYRHDQT